MLRFKLLKPYDIYNDLGEVIDREYLYEYDRERPGILEDVDIFCQNSRSKTQYHTRFDLFELVDDIDECDFLVFSIYLELFL